MFRAEMEVGRMGLDVDHWYTASVLGHCLFKTLQWLEILEITVQAIRGLTVTEMYFKNLKESIILKDCALLVSILLYRNYLYKLDSSVRFVLLEIHCYSCKPFTFTDKFQQKCILSMEKSMWGSHFTFFLSFLNRVFVKKGAIDWNILVKTCW